MSDPIVREMTDVPASDVDEVQGDFESEGCTVVRTKQPDGNFTLTATCPAGD